MAAYLKYNPQTSTHGKFIQSAVTGIALGTNNLRTCLANLATMIDGDPSNSANYTVMAISIGAADEATAKAIYDELSSLNGKLTTDGSVTFVAAAIAQALAKLTI
jgi:hypothetical protein